MSVGAICRSIRYYHILFQEHELLTTAGLPCESLYLGDQALAALSDEAKDEIRTLFPSLQGPGLHQSGTQVIRKARLQKFIHRSLANKKALFDARIAS